MTPDERNLLTSFLGDLAQTPATSKDPEAASMISAAVQSNPDALYLLVQHAILADQALHAAQAQISAMQSQQAPAPSFLQGQANPPAYQPAYQPAYGGPFGGQQGGLIPQSPFGANSGLGGFLKTAGVLAAGVAGGDFIAQGIENIFSPRW